MRLLWECADFIEDGCMRYQCCDRNDEDVHCTLYSRTESQKGSRRLRAQLRGSYKDTSNSCGGALTKLTTKVRIKDGTGDGHARVVEGCNSLPTAQCSIWPAFGRHL